MLPSLAASHRIRKRSGLLESVTQLMRSYLDEVEMSCEFSSLPLYSVRVSGSVPFSYTVEAPNTIGVPGSPFMRWSSFTQPARRADIAMTPRVI